MKFFNKNTTTINQFDVLSKDWWNKDGSFKLLHLYNNIRVPYITKVLESYSLRNNKNINSLQLLDVGCGGGLLCEPLAKIGINVTGLDTSKEAIKTASLHASSQNLTINYLNQELSSLPANKQFDVILIMEILEHVTNLNTFMASLFKLLKDDGIILFSTINRNIKSLLLAKIAAEYILNWLPRGIHEYQKFIKPFELDQLFQQHNFSINDLKGVNYSILQNTWQLDNSPSINYMGYASKR